jgi:hypothetical protein
VHVGVRRQLGQAAGVTERADFREQLFSHRAAAR